MTKRRRSWSPESCVNGWVACGIASASSGGVFDVDGLRARLEALEAETARPDLWENRGEAENLLREKRGCEREIATFDRVETDLEDAEVLLELAAEADDEHRAGVRTSPGGQIAQPADDHESAAANARTIDRGLGQRVRAELPPRRDRLPPSGAG